MKTLKIQFYKVPKHSKHRCSARFHDSAQFTKEELNTAIELIKLAIKSRKFLY